MNRKKNVSRYVLIPEEEYQRINVIPENNDVSAKCGNDFQIKHQNSAEDHLQNSVQNTVENSFQTKNKQFIPVMN